MERLGGSPVTTCAELVTTSPGYFEALGVPLLAGRTLTRADHDRPETGSVVVSKAFADRFWPGENPLGKGLRTGVEAPAGEQQRYYRIVGVVGDIPATSLEAPPAVAVYYPIVPMPGVWAPAPSWNLHMVVRTELADPMDLVPAIRAAVQELDPMVPIAGVETMRELVDASMGRTSFSMVLLGIAAAVALLLAAIGLYGVVSYVVARRTAEIGIRLALGAGPRQVERAVVRGSLTIVVVGLAVGMGAALVLTRLMRGMLYGVEPTDPMTYLLASFVICGIAVLASYVPARRAARLDPTIALSERGF
jgi:predicted permease